MTFIFRNRTIFWDISKWNRGQKKWDGGSITYKNQLLTCQDTSSIGKQLEANGFENFLKLTARSQWFL